MKDFGGGLIFPESNFGIPYRDPAEGPEEAEDVMSDETVSDKPCPTCVEAAAGIRPAATTPAACGRCAAGEES
jgi:hypothetical protein